MFTSTGELRPLLGGGGDLGLLDPDPDRDLDLDRERLLNKKITSLIIFFYTFLVFLKNISYTLFYFRKIKARLC